ncbi:Polygalacturonase [Heracleum sosnowskyi]|uniref:Polygalacturonase n=1 Tax=Heracleum sosnowskyi TaxID=360622 RepID=A0AAD8MMV1_9APIA|nr:Polygalacturonase [Heracleum sosnowskyi]
MSSLYLLVLFFLLSSSSSSATITYNILHYGAQSGGQSDSSNAFLSAWGAACATTSSATIYVPPGRFLLRNVYLYGDICKNGAITIRIDGVLVAPSDYNVLGNSGSWIKFERVTGVSIYGGTLDGQGTSLWACKTSGKKCPEGATTLAFYNSNKITISGLTSVNSQKFHIVMDSCHNVNLSGIRVSASGNSPNTDGIHLQSSSGITVFNSHISTGDDCISIGPGNSNLWIEKIACGPGHGISIGSLGWTLQEPGVQNVTVKTVTFTGTENGVRIKTWARPSHGFVKGVLFQHLQMVNVQNPVIIDQNYCPGEKNCPRQASNLKISGVTYEDIHGSSATEVGVKLDCSKASPCDGIRFEDVKLTYKNKPVEAICTNVGGKLLASAENNNCL